MVIGHINPLRNNTLAFKNMDLDLFKSKYELAFDECSPISF